MKNTLIFLALALTASCASGDWNDPGPRERFESFLLLSLRGEPEKMYELIDPEDRERFEATRASLSDLDPKVVPEPHRMFVRARLISQIDVRRIDVSRKFEQKPADGDLVELSILLQDDSTVNATMVWRENAWFLDFPDPTKTQ